MALVLLAASSENRVWNDPSDFTALGVGDSTGHDAHDAALATSIHEGPVCCYKRMCNGCAERIVQSRDGMEMKGTSTKQGIDDLHSAACWKAL